MFIVNVEGAIYKDGKWLIIERSKKEEHAGGLLSLIGGKVDQVGYSSNILEKTLAREALEEVGVRIQNHLYVTSTSFVTDKGQHVVNIIFYCEYESGEPYAKSPDEVESVMWLTTEEIILHPQSPEYLIDYIKQAEELAIKKSYSNI